MCFFLSHSFVALAVCFGSLSCWNTHPRPIFNALVGFNALALTVHVPFHCPFDAVQLFCPLSRKTPPKHNVSTSVFDVGVCSWGHRQHSSSASFDYNTFTHFSSESLENFRRLTVHVLSWARGPCGRSRISVIHGVVCYQLFSWWLWSQLPWDHWQYPPV